MRHYLRWMIIFVPGAGFIWWLCVEAMPVSRAERPAAVSVSVDDR